MSRVTEVPGEQTSSADNMRADRNFVSKRENVMGRTLWDTGFCIRRIRKRKKERKHAVP